MAQLSDVQAALDQLEQSVQALPGRVQPQDLQPVVDRVNAIRTEVDAIDPTTPAA